MFPHNMHVSQMHGYALSGQYMQPLQYGSGMQGMNPIAPPMPVRPANNSSQNQSTSNSNPSISKQLDNLVANTKWLQCTTLIDSWISRATQVMENGQQLEPYVPFESTISESGTDLSHAQTAPFEEVSSSTCSESIEMPASPPWRNASEGGELAVPPLASESSSTVLSRKSTTRSNIHHTKNPQDSPVLSSMQDLSLMHAKKTSSGAHGGSADRGEDTRHPRGHSDFASRKTHSHAATADSAEGKHDARLDAKQEASAAPKPEAKQVTLGIILGKAGEEGGMIIMRIKDGGIAALHGGLAVGMRVLAIDGRALDGLSPIEINRLTTGPEGSTAVLEVLGDGDAPVRVEIARVLRAGGGAAARPATGARGFGVLKKD